MAEDSRTAALEPLEASAEAYDCLMREDGADEGKRTRSGVKCQPSHMRFVLPKTRSYTHQYSHVYLKRLHALRRVVERQAERLWGKDVPIIDKVISLSPGSGPCVAIGTLYKQQSLKPSVLAEFEEEFKGEGQRVALENYCSDDDQLVLEDESGRMDILGLEQDLINSLLTGIIVGMKGRLNDNGEFVVEEYCFPGFAPQEAFEPPPRAVGDAGRYLVLASSLSVGDSADPLRLQMLVDYLAGHLGAGPDQALEAAIARVIVAGGSVRPISDQGDSEGKSTKPGIGSRVKQANRLAVPVKQLDCTLAELASSLDVDLMPGLGDPCSVTMPQQPLHRCLFPHSERFEQTFHRVTNPYECSVGEASSTILILGHSGQPVNDMLRYTRGLDALDLMEASLRWRHIAPTAPDTLPCYPLTATDPFVVTAMPHLFFAGGQDAFSTRYVSGRGAATRLVAVPRFAETGEVVLVDLHSPTLECSTISFDVCMPVAAGDVAMADAQVAAA